MNNQREIKINDETSAEEVEKIILNLKVGQFVEVAPGDFYIARVPGGWVYSSPYQSSTSFVPEK